jgi:hypothetical protein
MQQQVTKNAVASSRTPLLVEVDRQEEARFVLQHRVDARDKRLALVVLSGQTPPDHVVGHREKTPVKTLRALDSRFLADAANPFVRTRGPEPDLPVLRLSNRRG